MPKRKKFLARVQKTSLCPRCGKRFANETRVLQHLNQPSSVCGASLNDFSPNPSPEPISQTINPPQPPGLPINVIRPHSPEDDTEMDVRDSESRYDDHWQMDIDDTPHDDQQLDTESQDPTPSHPGMVEMFPRASQTFPHGQTFMDQFFSDKYGELRKDNLFYPFASQQDWQVASWLLRSRLSMAAIDGFLSLDLVRYISCGC